MEPQSTQKLTLLEKIGGEPVLKKLVNDFYDLIETHPRGAKIMDLHFQGHGLMHVRQEQFDFLSGFMGGRRYYKEDHGHMDLRLIHDHVPITLQEAEDWLFCMDVALEKNNLQSEEIDQLRLSFRRICMMLVNKDAED